MQEDFTAYILKQIKFNRGLDTRLRCYNGECSFITFLSIATLGLYENCATQVKLNYNAMCTEIERRTETISLTKIIVVLETDTLITRERRARIKMSLAYKSCQNRPKTLICYIVMSGTDYLNERSRGYHVAPPITISNFLTCWIEVYTNLTRRYK